MSSTTTADLQEVTSPKSLRVRGTLAVQRGTVLIQTFTGAGDLVLRAGLDTFNPVTKEGYQRELQRPRVRQAADYYRMGGRMPNPILGNVRQADFRKIEVRIEGDEPGYHEAVESGGDWYGQAELVIPAGVTVWVYDGQHREAALEDLLSADRSFSDFPVPLSLTLGLDRDEEMTEFYEVNQNAKAVKTDLAWDILRRRAQTNPELATVLEEKGQDWITRGADVTDALVALGGVWAESIQEANVRKARTDRLTLNKAQFIRSLQPVLSMPLLAKANSSTIAQILHAYWEGIARVLPEPFAMDELPKKWVIQKGPGAIAFHRVLPQVIEIIRGQGKRLADPDAYAEVLAGLPLLSGEVVTESEGPHAVSGSDFWRSGSEGVASQWTGDAGRKRLAVRLQALLPKPEESLTL